MKAIVLTFDKYMIFTDHMILTYQNIWPNNPFIFKIPYQNETVKKHFIQKYGEKVELVKSLPGIKDTMVSLLDGLGNNEWVYWCMDDRYLIKLELSEMQKTYEWIQKITDTEIAAVKCISHLIGNSLQNLDYFKGKIINEYNQIFYRRKNYRMIWIHQFLRVKVLEDLFEHIPRSLLKAKDMDYIVDNLFIPSSYNFYSYKSSIMILGESTSRGKITRNCYESLMQHNYTVPNEFEILNKSITSGEKINVFQYLFFYSKWLMRIILEQLGFKNYFRKRDVKHEKIKA